MNRNNILALPALTENVCQIRNIFSHIINISYIRFLNGCEIHTAKVSDSAVSLSVELLAGEVRQARILYRVSRTEAMCKMNS